jgi:hypothetical protein
MGHDLDRRFGHLTIQRVEGFQCRLLGISCHDYTLTDPDSERIQQISDRYAIPLLTWYVQTRTERPDGTLLDDGDALIAVPLLSARFDYKQYDDPPSHQYAAK